MTSITAEINFNSHGNKTFGSSTTGINIYNQIYTMNDAFNYSMTTAEILEKINKYVSINNEGYVFKATATSTSNIISMFKACLGGGDSDNTEELYNCCGIVFQCTKPGVGPNGSDMISYYCYFKDGTQEIGENNEVNYSAVDGKTWLLYFANEHNAPVVFQLQNGVEPTFTIMGTGESKKYTNINTGNFELKSASGIFDLSGVELKNTSFNLAIDEKKESKVNILPFLGFQIKKK